MHNQLSKASSMFNIRKYKRSGGKEMASELGLFFRGGLRKASLQLAESLFITASATSPWEMGGGL